MYDIFNRPNQTEDDNRAYHIDHKRVLADICERTKSFIRLFVLSESLFFFINLLSHHAAEYKPAEMRE